MLVLEAGAQEVMAAGFEEADLGGVMQTRTVSRAERRLSAYQRGEPRVLDQSVSGNTRHTQTDQPQAACVSVYIYTNVYFIFKHFSQLFLNFHIFFYTFCFICAPHCK